MANSIKKPLNEETVKNRIVIPLFKSMDFSPEEIEYEVLVTIQVGHGKINIGSKESQKKGFSDILFKKGNQPLVVIETKPQRHPLTEKDRDQAISYARLLMAPITLVTNGIEAKIYDTKNKECLNDFQLESITEKGLADFNLQNSTYVKNRFKISIDEDLKYEALKNLIGYNLENLLAFSKGQVEFRMNLLKGSLSDLSKKFIPELYVKKTEVKKQIENFIKDEKMIFSLVGEQGVGKTNFMCNLAVELLNKFPVLFFNCSFLSNGIFEAIAEDFNWTFPSEKTEIQIVKRIEDITKNHNIPIFFILDAIDEWEIPRIEKVLSNFIARIKNKNIKLVVSCKETEWKGFLKILGLPTEAVENSFKPTSKNLQLPNEIPGVKLNRLSNQEHKEAIEKYRKIFNFKAPLIGNTFEESKLFFMLRVVAEVYKESDLEIPPDLSSVDLLKKYLDLKLEKIINPPVAKDIISKIGNEIYLLDKNEIEERVISEKLGINIGSEEYKSLFSHYILQAKEDNFGIRIISFYFEKIRDFIISFYSQGWRALRVLNEIEFNEKIPEILSKSLGESILKLYLSSASTSHLKAIFEYNVNRLESCIYEYENIIEDEFPKLKDKFFPYGKASLGMIYLVNAKDKSIDGFGFREIDNKHPEKISSLNIPFFDFIFGSKDISNKLYFDCKIHNLKKNYSLITINSKLEVREFIKEQLKKIVEKGRLYETQNLGFATEETYVIIYYHGRKLGFGERKLDTIKEISSFSCNEILKKLEHHKIYNIAEEFYIDKLKKEGKIKEEKRGTITSYSYSPANYRNEIEKLAQDMIDKKIPIPNIKPPLIESYNELKESIQIIKKYRDYIGMSLLPIGDLKKPLRDWQSKVSDYSDEGITEYVKSFFRNVFNEYKILVEVNFPTIKDNLPLYKSFPIHFFAEISPPQKYIWDNKEPDREIVHTFLKSDEEIYEIHVNPTTKKFHRIDIEKMTVFTKKGEKKVSSISCGLLISDLMTGRGLYFKTPVRSFVYQILIRELGELKII